MLLYLSKKNKILIIGAFIFLTAIISLFAFFRNRFLFSTINDINVTGLTLDEANKKVNDIYLNNKFVFIGKQKIPFSYIAKLPIDISDSFKKHFSKNTVLLELKDNFYEVVNKDRKTETTEANVYRENGKLILKPRIVGDKLNKDKLRNALENAINQGQDVFMENDLIDFIDDKTNFKDIEYRIVSLKNKKFIVRFKNIDSIEECLEFSDIEKFIDVKKEGNKFVLSYDKEAILEYVKKLDKEYRTIYKAYIYRSTDGKDITINNNQGIGYDLDYDKSVEEIIRCLENNLTEIILPLDKNFSTLTSTYVEVNLSTQIMRVVKDGNVVLETPVVTGKDKTPTSRGIFLIYTKQTNRILRGNNDDGSKYAVTVNYWLPFDGGIGIHDANRPQSDYVANTYHRRGSHGCINTPKDVMKDVFNYLDVNFHVVVI